MVSATPHLHRWHVDHVIASRLVYRTTGMCWPQGSEVGPPWASPNPHTCLDPNVSWGFWACLRRRQIPRSAPSARSVFFPAVPVSLGVRLVCSPVACPPVAGSPKALVGQASVLLQEYLFFSPSGVGSRAVHGDPGQRPPPPGFAPGDWGSGNSGSRELRFGEHWLELLMSGK